MTNYQDEFYVEGNEINYPKSYSITSVRSFLDQYRDNTSMITKFITGFVTRWNRKQDHKVLQVAIQEAKLSQELVYEIYNYIQIILDFRRLPLEERLKRIEIQRKIAEEEAKIRAIAREENQVEEEVEPVKSEFEIAKEVIFQDVELDMLTLQGVDDKASYLAELKEKRRAQWQEKYPDDPDKVERLVQEYERLFFEIM